MNAFQRIVRLSAALGAAALLGACGTPMGLTKQTTKLDLSKESAVLATFEVTRSNGRLMPDPRHLFLRGAKAADGSDRVSLAIDDEGMEQDTGKPRKLVMVRLLLKPGKYSLENVMGTITGFLAVGTWAVPLNLQFDVPENSVVYLGRISAHLRDRKDDEFRAGSLIPLIDQAALGISNATFDVAVSDQSAIDLPRFREAYSVLRNQEIQSRLLPAFDRTAFDREYQGATASLEAKPASAASSGQ